MILSLMCLVYEAKMSQICSLWYRKLDWIVPLLFTVLPDNKLCHSSHTNKALQLFGRTFSHFASWCIEKKSSELHFEQCRNKQPMPEVHWFLVWSMSSVYIICQGSVLVLYIYVHRIRRVVLNFLLAMGKSSRGPFI